MFNTLSYAKMLEEAGFSRTQAETSVKVLVDAMEDKLASKQDLKDLQIAVKQDMKDLQIAVKQDMKNLQIAVKQDMKELQTRVEQDLSSMGQKIELLESRMTIKMGSMLAASIVIMTALQKLL